jgi:hypothetical protein
MTDVFLTCFTFHIPLTIKHAQIFDQASLTLNWGWCYALGFIFVICIYLFLYLPTYSMCTTGLLYHYYQTTSAVAAILILSSYVLMHHFLYHLPIPVGFPTLPCVLSFISFVSHLLYFLHTCLSFAATSVISFATYTSVYCISVSSFPWLTDAYWYAYYTVCTILTPSDYLQLIATDSHV